MLRIGGSIIQKKALDLLIARRSNIMLQSEFLSDRDGRHVLNIIHNHGLSDGFNGYVQFWGRDKDIQLDGEFTTKELRCLLEISEYLNGTQAK